MMRTSKRCALFLILVTSLTLSGQEVTSPASTPGSNSPASDAKASHAVELTPDRNGQLSQDQIRGLMQEVGDKDLENDKRRKDYTYVEREERHTLDGKGRTKKTEIRTREILMIYGEQVERLIAKDDKPLSDKEGAKEEARIQKILDKRKNESNEDRQKRLRKEEQEREENRKFSTEIADAYTFRLVGLEAIGGRDTYVIDAEPRPGFQPHSRAANLLPKIRGRMWIDKAEHQWVKLDAEVIDTISFGLFLARLHQGTRILAEQARINDEVWLPKHTAAKIDLRLALLKNFNGEEDVTYRDYRKFRTDTRIVGVGELKDPN
jgi:hypothetical protein